MKANTRVFQIIKRKSIAKNHRKVNISDYEYSGGSICSRKGF